MYIRRLIWCEYQPIIIKNIFVDFLQKNPTAFTALLRILRLQQVCVSRIPYFEISKTALKSSLQINKTLNVCLRTNTGATAPQFLEPMHSTAFTY